MKKVLIITYYWPPSGGAGVQRWLKFAKYLPQFGWQPIVYTPENPDFSLQDTSLQNDIPKEAIVLKTKIWEPYRLYKLFSGKKGENANAGFFTGGKKSWKQRLSIFVRGNFFIPDPRVFWVKPSVNYLIKYLEKNPVDAIVSTGPPHSMHLIALALKKHFPNLKWIADFRDPWTEIDFYQDLNLTSWADKKHKRLEAEVLKSADEVVVIGNTMKEQFLKITTKPIHVIYNGYDDEDFKSLPSSKSDDFFSIVHVGSMNKDRNHPSFWKSISNLMQEDSEFEKKLKIKLIGSIDQSVIDSIHFYGIEKYVELINYLPHNEAIKVMASASVLYLSINNVPSSKCIITGKVFEYFALDIPVLCIGHRDGDLKDIVGDSYCGFEDEEKIKKVILSYFKGDNTLTFKADKNQFTRKVLTQQFTQILEK